MWGDDLRDTAVGGPVRTPPATAVAHFKRIISQQQKPKPACAGHADKPPSEAEKIAKKLKAAKAKEKPVTNEPVARSQQLIDTPPSTGEIVDDIEQAAKKRKRKKQVRLTDDQVRQAHTEYWHSLDTLKVVCKRWNVSESALRKRWQKLGLPLAGQGTSRYLRHPETAIALADPAPLAPDLVASSAEFIPDDLRSRLAAFRDDMKDAGIPVEISMSLHLHLVKEVTL
jgi:hypothetical protein